MREPQTYEPALKAADAARKRGGEWVLVLAFVAIVGLFVVGWFQPPRWSVMAVVGIMAALALLSSGTIARGLFEFQGPFKILLKDYREAYEEGNKRHRFVLSFTPEEEQVTRVLRSAAYEVLAAHCNYEELQEKGLHALAPANVPAIDPDALRELVDRRLNEERLLRNKMVQHKLGRFRELRDIAKWAGQERYNIRESWWDYIDPKDLPEKSGKAKRRRTGEGEEDLHPDDPRSCGCPPDDCPHGTEGVITPAPVGDLHRARTNLEQASAGLRGQKTHGDPPQHLD